MTLVSTKYRHIMNLSTTSNKYKNNLYFTSFATLEIFYILPTIKNR